MKNDLSRKELKRYAAAGSRKAISKASEMNVPFAVQQGRDIVRVFPNGRKETVGHVDKAYVRIPKKRYKMA